MLSKTTIKDINAGANDTQNLAAQVSLLKERLNISPKNTTYDDEICFAISEANNDVDEAYNNFYEKYEALRKNSKPRNASEHAERRNGGVRVQRNPKASGGVRIERPGAKPSGVNVKRPEAKQSKVSIERPGKQPAAPASDALEEQIAAGFDKRIVQLETTINKLRQLADASHAAEDEYNKRTEQATRTLNELLAKQERLTREVAELESTLKADEAQLTDFEQNKEQGLKKYQELLH